MRASVDDRDAIILNLCPRFLFIDFDLIFKRVQIMGMQGSDPLNCGSPFVTLLETRIRCPSMSWQVSCLLVVSCGGVESSFKRPICSMGLGQWDSVLETLFPLYLDNAEGFLIAGPIIAMTPSR